MAIWQPGFAPLYDARNARMERWLAERSLGERMFEPVLQGVEFR